MNLGFLLQRRGDLEGAHVAKAAAERWAATETLPSTVETPALVSPHAELTYRLADAVGEPEGAFNLGVLLHQRRDFAAAAAAYERAEQRGNRDAAFNLGVLLFEVGDLDGAEAAWRRCLAITTSRRRPTSASSSNVAATSTERAPHTRPPSGGRMPLRRNRSTRGPGTGDLRQSRYCFVHGSGSGADRAKRRHWRGPPLLNAVTAARVRGEYG